MFESAAEPGEWAVTGTFIFADGDPDKLEGKARVAFRSGFLGIASLGWSTLVQVVEASDADRAAVDTLANHLVAQFGAPSIADAVAAAEEEFEFTASLCDHPRDTLIALHRAHEDGEIRETFRTLRPKDGPKPLRAFCVPRRRRRGRGAGREVDLAAMGQPRRAEPSALKDFWLSCGHHLLDRDAGGGLVVTDEFLKVYLARPELAPPPEACAAERTLHAALLAEPRRPVSRRTRSRRSPTPMRARTGRCCWRSATN